VWRERISFVGMKIATLLLACLGMMIGSGHAEDVLGQGEFCYRVVPGWGQEALAKVSIANGHGLAIDAAGRILFLTDDPKNNVVILSPAGELLETWTARMPGAHGLTLVNESGREAVFITSTSLHELRKLTLQGDELLPLPCPVRPELYAKAEDASRRRCLLGDRGEFDVFDGYGKDYGAPLRCARRAAEELGRRSR